MSWLENFAVNLPKCEILPSSMFAEGGKDTKSLFTKGDLTTLDEYQGSFKHGHGAYPE